MRPSLPDRTTDLLSEVAEALKRRSTRFLVLGTGLAVTIGLHAVLRDGGVAWGAVPLVLLAGLAGGVHSPLVLAMLAVTGHLAVDLAIGIEAAALPGIGLRSAVLPGVALVGKAGQLVERQRNQAMQRAVVEDPITGLLNVRAFYEELQRLRADGQEFTILLADIRGMRALNESYGHPTGTEAMRALAHVLRRETGPDVRASRLGSDEVAVVLTGEQQQHVHAVVDGIIGRLHNEPVSLPDGQRFEVHAAYGIARYPQDGDDAITVLRAADQAKERAKLAGLDRVAHADDNLD